VRPACHDSVVISTRRRVIAAIARPLMRLTDPAHRLLSHQLTPKGADLDAAPYAVAVRPEAQPYAGGTGPVGVLLCHGFSGTPQSMRPWAEHLERAGYRVSLPRLPGHGTSWTEMNLTTWPDWYGCVERAFLELEDECEQVFVVGLSMGGALSLRLAEQFGSRVAGLVLVNPVINITDPRMKVLFLLRALPSLGGIVNDIAKPGVDECGYDRNPLRALYSQTFLWRDVVDNLAKVDQPLLVYRSLNDHVGDPSSVELIRAEVKSADHSYVELTRSYHVATLDYEADDIFDGSVKFIRRLAAAH
jgi:carboxylesterase